MVEFLFGRDPTHRTRGPYHDRAMPHSGDESMPAEPFEIGGEYAAALESELVHQQAREGAEPSPLAGVQYDFWAGHQDLVRLVSTPVDDIVRGLVTSYRQADNDERSQIRSALTMDDFYTLLTFARRGAVRALQATDPQLAADAVAATALIDAARVDWRDILVALGLASHVLRGLSADATETMADLQDLAHPDVAKLIGRFIDPSDEDAELASWGYLRVDTSQGTGFVELGISDYAPTQDLVDVALQVAGVLEADRYRTSSISAGEELAPVWIPGATAAEADLVIDRCRGCIILNARLEPDAHSHSDAQQLTVFIVEADTEAAARQLHDWVRPTDASTHQAISAQQGPLVCVTIARSFVSDAPAFETADSLERFLQPLEAIVASAG